jgi:hypothetical protein
MLGATLPQNLNEGRGTCCIVLGDRRVLLGNERVPSSQTFKHRALKCDYASVIGVVPV